MPAYRIDRNEVAHYLYDGDKMIATGSKELCDAVRDGTVPDYIKRCEAEREKLGIGAERTRKSKKGK